MGLNILITPHNWLPHSAAGGEWYLCRLCKHLIRLGHEVKCICYTEQPYTFDGIECYPEGEMQTIWLNNNHLFEWCDVVIYQLLGNAYGYNKAKQHKKKSVFIAHNPSTHYFIEPNTAVVYNSHSMGNLYPNNPSTVLQPLVDYRDFTPSKGTKIALINCNENKGGKQFIELAKLMPYRQFIGIKGMYGEQVTAELPNLEYIDNGIIPWRDIGVLLVPSEIESWSQVATEAICCGIPVICSDLPGLRENLSYAGIFIERNDIYSYKQTIDAMPVSQTALCLKRAKELDPMPRVKEFEKWLVNYLINDPT